MRLQLNIATVFGAFLDPVADKIMVSTALIMLAADPPAPLSQANMAFPVVIIICREITMSALREWASAAGGAVHKVRRQASTGPLHEHTTAVEAVVRGISSLLSGPWFCQLAAWLLL